MIGRRELLESFVASAVAAWSRAWGPALPAIGPLSDASPHYLRAFDLLSELTAADRTLITGWLSAPLDADALGLIRRATPALSAFRRGAEIPGCDWGETVRSEDLNRNHLDVFKIQVGKLALLRARFLAESGRDREALDDIFAVAGFGRHVGSAGLWIARLFQAALENQAITALAASLPKLDGPALGSIPARIVSLPTPCSWSRTMHREGRFIISTVTAKLEAARSPIGIEALTEAGLGAEDALAVFERTGGDRSRIRALVDGVVPCLARLAEVQELPLDLHGPALEGFRVRESNPFARSIVEMAGGLKFAVARTDLLWTMVLAALTRIIGGPERFRAVADPYGDGPFTLRSRGDGFELRSALSREGQSAAALIVGVEPVGPA